MADGGADGDTPTFLLAPHPITPQNLSATGRPGVGRAGPYAAVEAIWPKRPGPADCAGAAAGGGAVACWGGAAAVEEGLLWAGGA